MPDSDIVTEYRHRTAYADSGVRLPNGLVRDFYEVDVITTGTRANAHGFDECTLYLCARYITNGLFVIMSPEHARMIAADLIALADRVEGQAAALASAALDKAAKKDTGKGGTP